MKKIVFAGLVAISMIAISQQQASAWVNSRFGVGLNWDRQSGGNQVLWGAWRNGQPPAPEGFGGGYTPSFSAPAPQPHSYAPMPQNYPAQAYYYNQPSAPAATYAGQYATPYQFANYPRPVYYYPDVTYYYYGR